MTPPAIVGDLVQRFHSHREAYRSGQYNEAQLREEFLNPFFKALGWDVYNEKTVLQRQIDATDQQIDRLVYELYGLSDEEITVVERGERVEP